MTCCKEKDVNAMLDSDGGSAAALLETTAKRKKKFTGGNASKRHRDRVNIEFTNLAKLLPFPESVIAKLDKSSILRLAVSFIRAKSFFKDAERTFENDLKLSKNGCKTEEKEDRPRTIKEGNGMLSHMFSHALDGFLLVLTEDMKVLFVSDSVRDYLGYCQAGIIHENFLQFVNPADHAVIQSSLMYRKHEIEAKHYNVHQGCYQDQHPYNRERNGSSHARRQFVCRMKCAFSCSSRFYTAYRTFRFAGHLRRSIIQEGREQKHLNSLILYAIPHSAHVSSEPNTERPENSSSYVKARNGMENNDYGVYYERFDSGFRIEPTLRPHISPIPVSRSEHHAERHPASMVPRNRACTLMEMNPFEPRPREHILVPSQHSVFTAVSGPASNESRYSDYSDDSKCSPASSPNLVWKNRSTSPYLGQIHNNKPEPSDHFRMSNMLYRGRENNVCRTMTEQEYRAMKRRATAAEYEIITALRAIKCEPCNEVNESLVNYERDIIRPPDVPSCCTLNRVDRKRYSNTNEFSPEKRVKTNVGSKSSHFNISSLLGLDKTETPSSAEIKPSVTEEDVDVCAIEDESDKRCSNSIEDQSDKLSCRPMEYETEKGPCRAVEVRTEKLSRLPAENKNEKRASKPMKEEYDKRYYSSGKCTDALCCDIRENHVANGYQEMLALQT